MAPRRPTSTGRKKIEIRCIECKEARQVCFSKRRAGLFNKATELVVMCGAEVAAVAFSPSSKAFSYGHPSVESVLNRFLPSNSAEAQATAAVGGDRNLALEELKRQHRELRAWLEAQKARKEALEEPLAKARVEGFQVVVWLDSYVSQMGEEDLVAFAAALEMVPAATAAHANQMLQQAMLAGHTMHGSGADQVLEKMMMLAMPPPPPTGYLALMEAMHQQQQQMVAMPPPGFAAGMEMMPQALFTSSVFEVYSRGLEGII